VSPQAASTGEAAQDAATNTAVRSDRPIMVFVPDDDQDNKYNRKLLDIVFKNEKLAVGAKFFRTLKVNASDVSQDRLLKAAGKSTPRVIFLRRDYTVSAVLEKRQLSAGKIISAMKRVVNKEYKTKFDKLFKGYVKLLNELDRLEARKSQVADLRSRLQAKPNRSKLKKLEKMEREYKADREAWAAKEKEMLALEMKGAKKGPDA